MIISASDTIAAVATGSGRAGIGIVRVSGPLAPTIASAITGASLQPRHAAYLPFLSDAGNAIDVGIALLFNAPHSYTGEHVLELQGHGGPVVLDLLLSRVVACGARLALPGEFTERAFLNDKLDLAQAEAVADLIDSSSASAAQAAVRSMSGVFSDAINAIQSELTALRAWLEAALDFSDEDIDFLADPQLQQRANTLVSQFDDVLLRAQQGQRLRDGLTVVIAGVTNVGKSSLLNALSGEDTAIVTDIAGTTRDVLHQHITLDGIPVHIIDTAGLRETTDVVELEGISRARQAIDSADHVLVLMDAGNPEFPPLAVADNVSVTLLLNKTDLLDEPVANAVARAVSLFEESLGRRPVQTFAVSIKNAQGVSDIEHHLLQLAGHDAQIEGAFSARRRHLDAIVKARDATNAALQQLRAADMPELAAEELRQAQLALDSVTGKFDSEDLLGQIFSSFCIGK